MNHYPRNLINSNPKWEQLEAELAEVWEDSSGAVSSSISTLSSYENLPTSDNKLYSSSELRNVYADLVKTIKMEDAFDTDFSTSDDTSIASYGATNDDTSSSASATSNTTMDTLSDAKKIAINYELKKIHARLLAIQTVLEKLVLVGNLRKLYILVISLRDLLKIVVNNIPQYVDKIDIIISSFYKLIIYIMRQMLLKTNSGTVNIQQNSKDSI